MKICIDDGSTNIKMQWKDGKGFKQHVIATSFKHGFSAAVGDIPAFNYTIGPQQYTFDQISSGALRTTEVRYQYGDLNLVAVHHALLTSGIEPQPVEIVVTLPISEYFDADHQLNTANIEKKKANLMRPVECLRREGFTITSVEVMPESIPAAFVQLTRMEPSTSLLIVDLGGTTLDVAQVRGQASGIVQIAGAERVGVRIMTEAVQQALASTGAPSSAWIANLLIEKRHDDAFLDRHLTRDNCLDILKQAIESSRQTLIGQVVQILAGFRDYTDLMVIGGGAELVAEEVRAVLGIKADRFYKSKNSQFDLVNGMSELML